MGRLSTGCSTIELRNRFGNAKKNGTVESILNIYIQLLNKARYCLCNNKFCESYKFTKIDLINHKKKMIRLIDKPEESALGKHQWRGQKQKQ